MDRELIQKLDWTFTGLIVAVPLLPVIVIE